MIQNLMGTLHNFFLNKNMITQQPSLKVLLGKIIADGDWFHVTK